MKNKENSGSFPLLGLLLFLSVALNCYQLHKGVQNQKYVTVEIAEANAVNDSLQSTIDSLELKVDSIQLKAKSPFKTKVRGFLTNIGAINDNTHTQIETAESDEPDSNIEEPD